MRDGLKASVSYGLKDGGSWDINIDQHPSKTLLWIHNIVMLQDKVGGSDADLQARRNRKKKLLNRLRQLEDSTSIRHQVVSYTSNSHRPYHHLFQYQELRGAQLQEDLGERDDHQLHSRATYMGIALPYSASSWT